MTQYECYEAALKKKFHIQMIAQRLGWLEDSRELRYAYRCSLGSPRAPQPHELSSPTKAVLTGKAGREEPLPSCTLLR